MEWKKLQWFTRKKYIPKICIKIEILAKYKIQTYSIQIQTYNIAQDKAYKFAAT